MMRRCAAFLLLTAFIFASPASGQDAFSVKDLELLGNFETMSVYLPCQGELPEGAAVRLRFRRGGEEEWHDAQPPVRIRGGRYAGCIFGLEPGTEYRVEVVVVLPEGKQPIVRGANGKTRSDAFAAGDGRTLYVSPDGRNGAAGTQEQPFAAIREALDAAEPGDVVQVMPGVYHEALQIAKSGRPDAPITLRGARGAMLSGTDPRFEKKGNGLWTKLRGNIYSTTVDYSVRYMAEDGKRLYRWKTLDALEKGFEENKGRRYEVKGGWSCDEAAKTLYVSLPDGGDPNERPLQVARWVNGIAVTGRHIIIEGLDIAFFGDWLITVRASGTVIRNNVLHNVRNGIIVTGKQVNETLIESNRFYETSVWEWPWQMCKAHDPEGSAIVYTAGRGHVCRKNTIDGFFNGVVPSMWGRLDEEGWNADMDVHDNVMTKIGDDGLEPEGTCVNQRYFRNRVEDALVGLSIAPITTGPVWAVRNIVLNHHLTAVKLDSDSSGPVMLYHNTFVTTVTDTDHYSVRKVVNGIQNSGAYHGLVLRNNIIMGTDYAYCDWRGGEGPKRFSMDYDNLFTPSTQHFVMFTAKRYADLAAFSEATGYEKHGVSADPKFANLPQRDVTLTADSPLIDKGIHLPNINDDAKGDAPDLGAVECR